MTTLLEDLNDLIKETRAGFEAAQAVAHETETDDRDIEMGLEDIMDAERWSSSGLYHRICQLNGTPSLLTTDFPEVVAEKDDLSDKLRLICRHEEQVARLTKEILSRDDLDQATCQLLTEMHNIHIRSARWCKLAVAEWKPG